MSNENDIIAHFTAPSAPPLFLCLLWKMILDTDRISPIAYKYEKIYNRNYFIKKFKMYFLFLFQMQLKFYFQKNSFSEF